MLSTLSGLFRVCRGFFLLCSQCLVYSVYLDRASYINGFDHAAVLSLGNSVGILPSTNKIIGFLFHRPQFALPLRFSCWMRLEAQVDNMVVYMFYRNNREARGEGCVSIILSGIVYV